MTEVGTQETRPTSEARWALRELVAVGLGVVATFVVGVLTERPILIAPLLLAVALTVFLVRRRDLAFRAASWAALSEVSASRTAVHVGNLLSTVVERGAYPRLAEVDQLIQRRRHPSYRIFKPLIDHLRSEGLTPASRAVARQYLRRAEAERSRTRVDVVDQLGRFLDTYLDERTLVLLYGYSSTICEGLVSRSHAFRGTVLVLQDVQYGASISLGEHEDVKRHLEEEGVRPFVVPFEALGEICSSAGSVIADVDGRSLMLDPRRQVVALVGCEAYDATGTVLIPAIAGDGAPSETAFFVNVFTRAAANPDVPAVQAGLAVVGESFKAHRRLAEADRQVAAPVRDSVFARAKHLSSGRIAFHDVTLVELHPGEDYAWFIDNTGIHQVRDGTMDLGAAVEQWDEATIRRVLPQDGAEG